MIYFYKKIEDTSLGKSKLIKDDWGKSTPLYGLGHSTPNDKDVGPLSTINGLGHSILRNKGLGHIYGKRFRKLLLIKVWDTFTDKVWDTSVEKDLGHIYE